MTTSKDFGHAVQETYSESKLIIIACLASWGLGRLNFGIVWLLFILAFCRTQYEVSIRRVQRAIRDEVVRYQAEKNLQAQRGESVEWINIIVGKLWHLYERRFCDEIVRYINAELKRRGDADEDNPQRVVIHSLEVIEEPLRIMKVKVYHKPNSPNLLLEGEFSVNIQPIHSHHLRFLDAPLVDFSIVHGHPDRKHHDLAVHVRQFIGHGIIKFEFDFGALHPHLLQPHLEIQEKPHMDCTIKTISHHHFPFHFAHHVDWRKVVERQIREGLRHAFHQPLPLGFVFGEGLLIKIMRGLWHLHHYRDGL